MKGARWLALLASVVGPLAGCLQPDVARVVDGREVRGPFVSPAAYATYAGAALLEREGRLAEAATQYARAADLGHDAAAHARLGAVLCALERLDEAREAFDEGLQRDADSAVVHRERGRCALRRGALAEAVAASREAVRTDPDDLESVLLLAEALDASGEQERATALRDELAARRARTDRSSAAAGVLHGDGPAAMARGPSLPSTVVVPGVDLTQALRAERPSLVAIDAAFARGDLDAAQALGTAAHLPRAELAARALAHGHVALALAAASAVAGAEPTNGTAWCVAVAAAIRVDDEATLGRLLPSGPGRTPSPLATLLFAEGLLARGGPDAALAVAPPSALERERDDALEEIVRKRLATAIARAQ